ncbi:MAG: glycosyltransferase family 61 protein [Pseudomonadota bacterium]
MAGKAKGNIQDAWTAPPEDFFHSPGVDAGLHILTPLPQMWRVQPKARIAATSASAYPNIAAQITSHIERHFKRRAFRSGIEFATVPVLADHLCADGHFLSVNGKWLLSGAAGTRLRNRYAWKNEGVRDADAAVAAYFADVQAMDPPPPPISGKVTRHLPFVIDTRNGTNFYHFLTETLGQLWVVDHDDFEGPVHIHTKGEDVRPFLGAWIDALYPRLSGRVSFKREAEVYDQALTVLNGRHYYYQSGEAVMPSVDALAPDSHYWKGRVPDRNSMGVLAMNSCDEMLRRLRELGHARLADGDWDHLPRRFWVGRKSDRVRAMAGEAALIDALTTRGFAVVYFEDFTPLEQVALMARAEVMISYHGAGFANMVFAGPETHCIEIGTLQTCHFRWADFMPHVLASGCRYTSFFADYNIDNPQDGVDDRRGKDLASVALGDGGRAKLLQYLDAILGQVGLGSKAQFRDIADLLSRTEDHRALRRLFQAHVGAEEGDADLTILKANALIGTGALQDGFLALETAWQLTGNRPFLLERLILLGRELGRDTRRLEDLHGQNYPQHTQRLSRKMRRQRLGQLSDP